MVRQGCLVVLIVCVAWATTVRAVDLRPDAPELQLFRVFLADGTALPSYGEWARVDDRVVFSMPLGAGGSDAALQLVDLPASRVDWPRTERYAAAVRYLRYAATRGEADYAALSAEIARVLSAIALSPTPERGLELAEQARRTLAAWPNEHFGYRQGDVREILALLDEAISDLRAATGRAAFDLSLVALPAVPPGEALLPAPTAAEQVHYLMVAARAADAAADRAGLLQTALGLMQGGAGLASAPLAAWRAEAERVLADDRRVDRAYAALARRTQYAANRAAASADVRTVEGLIADVRKGDAKLGARRPGQVQALVAYLEAQLEAARALRLARDRWVMRAAAYRTYQRRLTPALLSIARLRGGLDAIRRLAGPEPATLASISGRLESGLARLTTAPVPTELRPAHDLLLSAWQMAQHAVRLRRDAVLATDLSRARDASTAAAGALLLFGRAQRELRTLLELPQLR